MSVEESQGQASEKQSKFDRLKERILYHEVKPSESYVSIANPGRPIHPYGVRNRKDSLGIKVIADSEKLPKILKHWKRKEVIVKGDGLQQQIDIQGAKFTSLLSEPYQPWKVTLKTKTEELYVRNNVSVNVADEASYVSAIDRGSNVKLEVPISTVRAASGAQVEGGIIYQAIAHKGSYISAEQVNDPIIYGGDILISCHKYKKE
jgi:hypothetical protein